MEMFWQSAVGGVESSTVIVWLHGVEVLPQASVATQVRVVVNSCGQVTPGVVVVETMETTGALSQASITVGVPKTGVAVHSMVVFDGQEIVGGVLSVTEMVRLHVAVLPQSSVAVNVRVTVFSCGQDPGVVASTDVMSTLTSHASVAVALPKAGAAGHSTVAGGFGQMIVGA